MRLTFLLAALLLVSACTAGPSTIRGPGPTEPETSSTPAPTAPASTSPQAAPPVLMADEATVWAHVRTSLPTGTPVAVPTWLPPTVDRTKVELRELSADPSDPRYSVVYRTESEPAIEFVLGPAPARNGSGIGLRVRRSGGSLQFPSSLFQDPTARVTRMVMWNEGDHSLWFASESIRGDDMIRIAWSLDPTSAPAPEFAYERSKVGACTRVGGAPTETLERLVGLMGSGDIDAIDDCYAMEVLERHGRLIGRSFADLPRATLEKLTDPTDVAGRVQIYATWRFESKPEGPWEINAGHFFILGLDDGRYRIYASGTGPFGPAP